MLQLNQIKMKTILKLFLLVVVLGFYSCGNDAKEETEVKNDEGTEVAGSDVTKETGKAGDEDELDTSNDLGMTPGLPPDFPNDVPQPPKSKVLGSLNSSEGTVVTFESEIPIKEIVDFYKQNLSDAGYNLSEGGEMLITEQGGLIGWKKDNKEVSLMLGRDTEKGITSIVVTYN